MDPALARSLGTRHRAAIGITEEPDCLALVVSEQTGAISVALSGGIEQNVSLRRVDEVMAKHFGRRAASTVIGEETGEKSPSFQRERRRNGALLP